MVAAVLVVAFYGVAGEQSVWMVSLFVCGWGIGMAILGLLVKGWGVCIFGMCVKIVKSFGSSWVTRRYHVYK